MARDSGLVNEYEKRVQAFIESRTFERLTIDWLKVEAVAGVEFDASIRDAIENEFSGHVQRSEEYAPYVDEKAYNIALHALSALVQAPSAKERMQPIERELERVIWFLEILAQPNDIPSTVINNDYYLYARIWQHIGKAGIRLSKGKGILNNKLSKPQRVFKELCAQAGIKFSNSDQALALALHRALKASIPTGSDEQPKLTP